ncbi:Asparagine synthetase (glutamine-hydrolyzing) [Rubrivivax sp. A210]|uniref:asparagine synthase-related protein n=1 Tax=Rubrivivax sp. A210 TaxID=2772301 RepID=UPI00191A07E8|nr:asparagine synthetase B family protein [Rubrivivax sp. A210]CAD5375199.1 Asparagine synthetase (glutamine-hydrolyzing) [Rubrivivax sp. A210]
MAAKLAPDAATVLALSQPLFPGEERPVATARRGPLSVALAGALDNRDEVLRRLGLAGGAGKEAGDAELVLALYEKFGLDAPQHLNGDWVFALRDSTRRRLVLARDATGHSALYWWQGQGGLLFASSLPVLMAANGVPRRPNARWLAGLLCLFSDPAQVGQTAYDGVQVVPQGHVLVAQAGSAELRRWWYPERLRPLHGQPLADLERQFLGLYDDAVRLRVDRSSGPVALMLSGGLDSGSVAALAAPALARRGRVLQAYVHTPRFEVGSDGFPGQMADEWALALTTARHVGNIEARPCSSDQVSPVTGIHRWLAMAAVPSFAPSNWYWLQDLCGQAAEGGARTLLVGSAGNGTVSYTGDGSLWHRLGRMEWATVQRELRLDRAGWAVAARERLLKPPFRPALRALRQAWANRGAVPPWTSYSLVAPVLASSLGLREAMREAGHDPAWGAPSAARVRQFRLSFCGGAENGNSEWAELGRTHGLDLCDPTRDRRLVEFCWRLPDELFWAQGQKRGLIRQSMRAMLPRELLENRRRGLQSADLRQRLQAGADELFDEFDRVSRHPAVGAFIDVRRLGASVEAVVRGGDFMPNETVAPEHLMRALAVAVFVDGCG